MKAHASSGWRCSNELKYRFSLSPTHIFDSFFFFFCSYIVVLYTPPPQIMQKSERERDVQHTRIEYLNYPHYYYHSISKLFSTIFDSICLQN